jgi:hypothetical protein
MKGDRMFKVWQRYTVRFEKIGNLQLKSGRFDTRCSIFDMMEHQVVSEGVAYLHPNDQYNRLLGKKIALTKALQKWSRQDRTIFWRAFWEWVDTWNKKAVE